MGMIMMPRKGLVHAAPVVLVPISTLPVGSLVKILMDNSPQNFRIVHQGIPDPAIYDTSCDGTWLMKERRYVWNAGDFAVWHFARVNAYGPSQINERLNSSNGGSGYFLSHFSPEMLTHFKRVKIPYVNGTGGSPIATGANGLEVTAFLASCKEVGFTPNGDYIPDVGAKLDYFQEGNDPDSEARRLRVCLTDSGEGATWWTRDPYYSSQGAANAVYTNGDIDGPYCNLERSVRPFLITTARTYVDPDGNVIA